MRQFAVILKVGVLSGVVLVAAFACGCAEAPRRDGAVPERAVATVVIGVRSDVSSFNLYTATNAFTQEVVDLLQLKLARENEDYASGPPSFDPGLARSWEFAPDGLSLTLHLEPAVRWSDGTALTAADVVFSHEAASSAAVSWVGRDVKAFIRDVEAPDPSTVVYRFSRRYPYQLMDAVEGNIVPSHFYGSVPFEAWPHTAFLEPPPSSGPFRLVRYERGATIELERNPDFIRAPLPQLQRVVFRVLPDDGALVNELLSGGIDVMEKVPADQVERIERAGGIRLVSVPDLSYTFICWNTSRPPFDDVRVRRAMTLAIDRASLIEGLLPRSGRVATGPIPSLLWAHHAKLDPVPFDPQRAREILAEVGWKDTDGDGLLDRAGRTLRFELETNAESRLRGRLVEAVAAQLRRIGVEAVPRRFEFGTFVERHDRHDFDAYLGSWRESTKVDLKSVFHSASIGGAYNYGAYADAELDARIDAAREAIDAERARALWWEAQEIIARDQPYTFLFERDQFHAAREGLAGFRPSPRSAYAGIEHWHWAPDVDRSP